MNYLVHVNKQLTVFSGLYRELGERGNEIENSEYEQKKEDDLQRRLSEAHSSSHHLELVRERKDVIIL